MQSRFLPLCGILIATVCFASAVLLRPGGYDWNHDYVSTLMRGNWGPSRICAIAGLWILCVSIAVIFARLASDCRSPARSKAVQIGGIGSMVYSALTVTPMHDLMVTISVPFMFVAVVALLWDLYVRTQISFFVTGVLCLALLVATVTIYYTGQLTWALPWTQRTLLALFAIWLAALDLQRPRLKPERL